jgi:hypothetical protein
VSCVNADVVWKGAAIHCPFEMLVVLVGATSMFDDKTAAAMIDVTGN